MPRSLKGPLAVRKVSGGVYLVSDETQTTGNYWFVNSVTGTDSVGNGTNPDAPFASIAYAITQCTANNGDRVFVMPLHTEAVIAAGTINFTVAGVSVIGLGEGDNRPTISWTTISTATMLMASANCRISNCIMDMSGISALVSGIVVSAAGCTISNNTVLTAKAGTGTAPTQSILTTAGANRLVIDNNQFNGPALTPTTVAAGTSCICLVGGTGVKITNNYIHGWFTTTTGCIYGITTLTNNCLIDHNFLGNQTASAAAAITLLTGSTGIVSNNRLGVLTGTAPIVADAVWWLNNYYAATKASAGVIL